MIKLVITLIEAFNMFIAPSEMYLPIFFRISLEIEEIDCCRTPKSISNFDDISVITAEMLLRNNTT